MVGNSSLLSYKYQFIMIYDALPMFLSDENKNENLLFSHKHGNHTIIQSLKCHIKLL